MKSLTILVEANGPRSNQANAADAIAIEPYSRRFFHRVFIGGLYRGLEVSDSYE
jgi:hypothetical protein